MHRTRRRGPRVLSLLMAGFTSLSLAHADAAEGPNIAYESFKLANGLEVLLHRDDQTPTVHVEVWYKVGSKDEEPGRTGFAHLFEHVMFQGTKHIGEDAVYRILSEAGASDQNGSTSFDFTKYHETVPANRLELALWMESSRMGFLLDRPSFESTFANQRDVVKNERRQRIENRAMGAINEVQLRTHFPASHPYHHDIFGSTADLDAAKVGDIKTFFSTYYAPNNAVLAIAGDFDVAAAKAMVEKYFGPIPAGAPVSRTNAVAPRLAAEVRVPMEANTSGPAGHLSWTTMPSCAPGDAELGLLAQVLVVGNSSRLHKRLVYDMKIAESVSARQDSNMHGGIFEISFLPSTRHTVAQVQAVVDEELERVRTHPIDAQDLERAKTQIKTEFFRRLESLSGRASLLQMYNLYTGDPGFIRKDLARYEQADAASVQRIAAEWLRPNARLVIAVDPNRAAPVMGRLKTTARPEPPVTPRKTRPAVAVRTTPDAPFRATPPLAAAEHPFKLPPVQRLRLKNGLKVILAESNKLPLVGLELVIKTGGAANPIDKAGLAALVVQMLSEGTTTRSAPQIAGEIEQLGATLAANSGRDASSVAVTALREKLDSALAVWADVVRNPAFTDADLTRVRDNLLAQIARQRDNASAVAGLAFARALYGDEHPFGWPNAGTEASQKRITAADLRAFHDAHYAPNNAVLVVAGAISAKELQPKIEALLGDWKAKPQPRLAVAKPRPPSKTKIFLINKTGAPQSSIRLGLMGLERKSPDYFKAMVMNRVLGGGFKRLDLNLREQKGWTYGANSVFEARRTPGPWFASGEFVAAHTADSVAELQKEMAAMRDDDVTDKELNEVKSQIIRAFPARFATVNQVAAQMATLAVYDLPDDDLEGFIKNVSAVTKDDVRKMAQKYLRPGGQVIVVVGDQQSSEAALRKLGDVELRDVEGAPLSPSTSVVVPAQRPGVTNP